jgi:peptidyl-prolyl cis-trans isomerase C
MEKRHIKIWWAIPIVAVLLASAGWFAVAQEKETSKGKVAVVNGSVITQEDFDRDMALVEERMAAMGSLPSESEMADVKKEVLENLINLELLYQESRKEGKKAEAAEVDQQMAALKERFPNKEDFQAALKSRNLTESDVRGQIEKGMSIQRLIEGRFDKIEISEKEAKEYYDSHQDLFMQPEQVRASHILIKVDSGAEEAKKVEARKKLEEIRKKIQEGGDFEAMAEEFSEDSSGKQGGDLGYFGRGQMVKPFEEAAFSLKPGEMSGLVESPFGYHLIKVTDRKPENVVPYEEIKEKLEEYLKQEKMNKEVAQYISSLKEKADVERFTGGS